MKYLKAEIMVGIFMLLGIIAAVILALKVAGLVLNSNNQTYKVYANFENVGSLRIRAPIRIGGVLIGRVGAISLDPKTLSPVVELDIESSMTSYLVSQKLQFKQQVLLENNTLVLLQASMMRIWDQHI